MSIALFDLKRQYLNLQEEIDISVRAVLEGGDYILGLRVRALEEQIAHFCGVKWGAGVASGTDALFLSLKACGVGPGDEVITSPYTFFATAGAVSLTGARPVFADINPRTYNIEPEKIEARITSRTKAIVPVHIFGQMADLDAVLEIARKYGLAVVEDACQALGSENRGRKAGSMGLAGCFSFFPTKILGCCGDGGMVVTGDEKVAAKIKTLRVHGSNKKFFHGEVGCNSRLDEIQAAILLVKLKHLDRWIDKRIALAGHYSRLLEGFVATPRLEPGNRHTYQLYVIRTPLRDSLREHLARNRVSSGLYYPLPLHLQGAFKNLGYRQGDFPEAEKASKELLALPLYPELEISEVERVASLVRQGVKKTQRTV